jgi:hypothetical protein
MLAQDVVAIVVAVLLSCLLCGALGFLVEANRQRL